MTNKGKLHMCHKSITESINLLYKQLKVTTSCKSNYTSIVLKKDVKIVKSDKGVTDYISHS